MIFTCALTEFLNLNVCCEHSGMWYKVACFSSSVILVVATLLQFVVLFKPLLVVSFSCLEYLVFHNNCFPCDQCWYFKFLYLHVGSLHIHFFIVLTEDNDPSKSSVSSGAALDAILLRLPTCVNKDFIDEVSRTIVWKLPSGFCGNFMRIRRISLEKRKIALQRIMYQWNSVKGWFCQDKREEYIIV